MVDTGKIRFWLPMFWQVKIKPQYMLQRNPVLQGYYKQNQQVIWWHKKFITKKNISYASWAMPLSPAFSNILQLSHFDRLINVLATYQVVTSMPFSSRTLSTISRVPVPKMSSVTVTHSWFSDVRSSSQKLIFSLSKERHCKILSEFRTSRKLTRNLPPFIRLHWEKRRSTGSLCSLAVIIYWLASFNKSSMSIAWVRRVVVNAEAVWGVSVNAGDWYHRSI